MGLLDIFKRPEVKVAETPYNVSGVRQWQDFSELIDSDNYLEQYSGWTYKAIKTKADSFVSYIPELYTVDGNGDTEEVKDNPLLRDLKRFNSSITYLDARKITQLHLGLAGIAYWYIVEADDPGYNTEFQILNPTQVKLTVDQFGEPFKYQFTDSDSNVQEINPEDLIIFREPHPSKLYGGYSPLQASRLSHNTYEYMSRFNMNVFGNMGRPDGLLAFEGVDEGSRKRLERNLKSKYGGVENARKIGIVNAVPKWVPITENNKDLDFVNGIVQMRDDILAMHGVPKPLVGLTDSTYTNSQEAQRVYQRYTLKPLLDNEESVYNEQLIKKYYGEPREDLVFKTPNPIEADKKAEAETATESFQGGYITINEARLAVGLERFDENDPRGEMLFNDLQLSKFEDFQDVANSVREESAKATKGIEKAIDVITKLPQLEETKVTKRDKVKQFYHNKAVEQEAIFSREVDAFFKSQQDRVLSSLKQKDVGYTFDKDKEAQAMYDALIGLVFDVSGEYEDIANEIVTTPYTLSKEQRADIGKSFKGSTELVNETTDGLLQEFLADANDRNLGLAEIKQGIQSIYSDYGTGVDTTRSETIARTTITNTKNFTQDAVFQSDDTVERTEWLSAHDSHTRDAHAAADGQTVKKGDSFKVGGEKLKYPGDTSGSAGNVINCRCTILPVIK